MAFLNFREIWDTLRGRRRRQRAPPPHDIVSRRTPPKPFSEKQSQYPDENRASEETPAQTAARIKIEEAAAEEFLNANVKECPGCRRAIMKSFGCDEMECYCGQVFCWMCLAKSKFDDSEFFFGDWHARTCRYNPATDPRVFLMTLRNR
ncbi:hypothetical protein LZ554_007694 [Drepanopeziza brunnea f. sp. 'monogermtubi']|nr:hypothetical protein LZ554_007694 [Drepanopeziza brunnea f. sp. 'monogermtubi']